MQIYTFLSKGLLKTPHRWLKWSLLSMVLYCFHSLIRKLLVCSHSNQGEMQSVSLAELALKVSFWSLFETHPPRQLAFQSLDTGKRIENIWRSQLVEQLIKCTLTCLERCLPMVAPQLLQPVPGQLFPTLCGGALAWENKLKPLTLCSLQRDGCQSWGLLCTWFSCPSCWDGSASFTSSSRHPCSAKLVKIQWKWGTSRWV